jgi:hypothetical protein
VERPAIQTGWNGNQSFCGTPVLALRLSLPEDSARDLQRRQECHVPQTVQDHSRHDQCLEMLDEWCEQVPHGWVTGDDELGRHAWFRHNLRERGARYVLWGYPAPRRCAT